jgi:hypothetical protein
MFLMQSQIFFNGKRWQKKKGVSFFLGVSEEPEQFSRSPQSWVLRMGL